MQSFKITSLISSHFQRVCIVLNEFWVKPFIRNSSFILKTYSCRQDFALFCSCFFIFPCMSVCSSHVSVYPSANLLPLQALPGTSLKRTPLSSIAPSHFTELCQAANFQRACHHTLDLLFQKLKSCHVSCCWISLIELVAQALITQKGTTQLQCLQHIFRLELWVSNSFAFTPLSETSVLCFQQTVKKITAVSLVWNVLQEIDVIKWLLSWHSCAFLALFKTLNVCSYEHMCSLSLKHFHADRQHWTIRKNDTCATTGL